MLPHPIPKELLDSLEYNEKSLTKLIWISSPGRRIKIGDQAGCRIGEYFRITYRGKTYAVHRIIWELLKGAIPCGMDIDHRDRNKLNNVISNLRLATHNQNQHNRSAARKNQYGVKGLSKDCNKWVGNISHEGQKYQIRSHNRDEVELWLKTTRASLCGEFVHH